MSGRASKRTLALVRVMLHVFSNPSWRDASLLPNSVEFSRWLTGAANPFMCPAPPIGKGGIAHATEDGPTLRGFVGRSDRAQRGGAGQRHKGHFQAGRPPGHQSEGPDLRSR